MYGAGLVGNQEVGVPLGYGQEDRAALVEDLEVSLEVGDGTFYRGWRWDPTGGWLWRWDPCGGRPRRLKNSGWGPRLLFGTPRAS